MHSSIAPCFAEHAEATDTDGARGSGYLARKLGALDDREGERVPEGLPDVVDSHVHVFPDGLFRAIWRWFDQHGWPIRYPLLAAEVVRFLQSRGVSELVLLTYAHKPGMARGLNAFVAELCAAHPRVLGCGTVMPGEPDAEAIVNEAFDAGLSGLKLHCHVQCTAVDAPELEAVYAICERRGRPIVVHAGREPKSPGYACDPHALCSADRTRIVLEAFPKLRLVVPHLGADEFDAYGRLLERHDNLWLDTTMSVAGYFPGAVPWSLVEGFPGRILYGTDFPNLPFAWDRELTRLLERRLSPHALELLVGGTSRGLFRRVDPEVAPAGGGRLD